MMFKHKAAPLSMLRGSLDFASEALTITKRVKRQNPQLGEFVDSFGVHESLQNMRTSNFNGILSEPTMFVF